jgi:S1-C subfamily serine protease
VRTTGGGDPPLGDATADVTWEVLDLAAGAAIYGRNERGTVRFNGAPDSAVAAALDQSLIRMISDSSFLRTLVSARATAPERVSFERPVPAMDEFIEIRADDIAPVTDTGAVTRVMAGVVSLRGPDRNYGTGILLTRDGLLLTTGSVVRHLSRVRARLANGVERPVRLLRRHGGLNVALLQVACPGDCPTVDWAAPRQLEVFAQVLTVGAPARGADSFVVAIGRIGGRWGLADGVTLETDVQQRVMGGEPVASAASGKVVAVVSTRTGRQSALMLADVLRALRVRPPAL